ncbi:hypothetical protein VIGAN_07212900, partial [Vigna angularis var. angularis]
FYLLRNECVTLLGLVFPKKSPDFIFFSFTTGKHGGDSTSAAISTFNSFFFARLTESYNLSSPPSVTSLVFIMSNTIAPLHGPPSHLLHPRLHLRQTVEVVVAQTSFIDDSSCF